MLVRIGSFFDFFELAEGPRRRGQKTAAEAALRAKGMMDRMDYEALAAILLFRHPRSIFEIGTYLGITADFILEMLPECRVVSIAYPARKWFYSSKRYNNSELLRRQIGSSVRVEWRSRFTQLYGDSHELRAGEILRRFGRFDMVLVDGDHTRGGVEMDTLLAREILEDSGVLCWHDANPEEKYRAVREFLEEDDTFLAIATEDVYAGGIAYWSAELGDTRGFRSREH